ncbi:hypothetical protein A8B79_05920 [Balneola sp. EhC07]|uniref:ABC transporter substrate-binding protein n=1 Tax=Balneola sp. EhC07 TaxID=1849360 RepID=UPI0007F47CB8|nr:ABC transporter substrate-binding protein [Balneola sp. EhC07]OAN61011.1 hypothetical protein A8B79_05920 [Balneola sp. EhC07]
MKGLRVLLGLTLLTSLSCKSISDKDKIVIAQFGDFYLYAPLYIAIDKGYFEKNNIDVSIVNTGGDELTWSAVLSGQAQFGIADPTFIAIAKERGQEGLVVANIVNGVPFWGVSYSDEIPEIHDPADLKDYTIATFPSPSTAYTLQKDMFLESGLEPKIREGTPGTLLAMLNANQVDIALELEPNVSQATANGAHVIYSMKELYGEFAITGLTTLPKTASDNPDLVKRITCSLQQSMDFIYSNPDSTVLILNKRFTELDTTVSKLALARILEEEIIPKTGVISDSAWVSAIDLRQDVGDLPRGKNYLELIDNSFSEVAISECKE